MDDHYKLDQYTWGDLELDFGGLGPTSMESL